MEIKKLTKFNWQRNSRIPDAKPTRAERDHEDLVLRYLDGDRAPTPKPGYLSPDWRIGQPPQDAATAVPIGATAVTNEKTRRQLRQAKKRETRRSKRKEKRVAAAMSHRDRQITDLAKVYYTWPKQGHVGPREIRYHVSSQRPNFCGPSRPRTYG